MKKMLMAVITATVTIILIAGLLVPVTHAPASPQGWQYDDYQIAGEDVSSATGSLEIKTIGTTKYIHAKSVGSGSIVHKDGTSETVDVGKAVLDLMFFWGQSNAAQYEGNASQATVPAMGAGYYFGDSSGKYAIEKDVAGSPYATWTMQPIVTSSGTVVARDKAAPFMAEYYEKTGHKTYLVDAAIGGQSIDNMKPTASTGWTYANNVLTKAISSSVVDTSKYTLNACYVIWIQGETDSKNAMAPEEYSEKVREVFGAVLHGDLAGIHFKSILTCLLAPPYATLNQTIEGISSGMADVYVAASAEDFTQADGTLGSDNTHYTQKGDNIIGKEFGAYAANLTNTEEGGSAWSLIGILPVLMILVVVVGFIGYFFGGRRE